MGIHGSGTMAVVAYTAKTGGFHMSVIQAVILSLLQGFSELFPVSSLGHAVLLPALLGWKSIHESSSAWLAFLVALHIGTAVALLIYFWSDWIVLIRAFFRSIQTRRIQDDQDCRLVWMVILGTVPAAIVGLVLQNPLRSLFASPYIAASVLILNGGIMFLGERLMKQSMAANTDSAGSSVSAGLSPREPGRFRDITRLTWRDAAIVGFAQVAALVPGISRSGVTMVAGLVAGLDHQAAARYAFLLATPIILAAGVLELPHLFGSAGRPILGDAIIGAILAGIAAYLSVRFLMRYFEFGNRLYPFALYCVAAGAISLILLSTVR
jgi:undecaprenyl-diphosphatase